MPPRAKAVRQVRVEQVPVGDQGIVDIEAAKTGADDDLQLPVAFRRQCSFQWIKGLVDEALGGYKANESMEELLAAVQRQDRYFLLPEA